MISESGLVSSIEDALSGKRPLDDIVKLVDDAVSSDAVYDYTDNTQRLVLELQDNLAFYVENDEARRECEEYYGKDKLRMYLLEFMHNVGIS